MQENILRSFPPQRSKLIVEAKKTITEELSKSDYATKKDIKDLEIKLTQLEAKMEKGFKEIIVWVIGAMVAIVGLAVAVIKIF